MEQILIAKVGLDCDINKMEVLAWRKQPSSNKDKYKQNVYCLLADLPILSPAPPFVVIDNGIRKQIRQLPCQQGVSEMDSHRKFQVNK